MFHFLDNCLNNHKSRLYIPTHIFLAVVTLIAVSSTVLDIYTSIGTDYVYTVIEWLCILIFTFEYIGRMVISKNKLNYIFSFWGLIDLISVLPTYLGLGNWSFLKTIRIVKILFIIKTAHLTKLSEVYIESHHKS